MKCNVIPYEGEESYIFFSYCHEDEWICYPIIERLVHDGFRVWFDDGLHPGDDWPDVVASKLRDSKVCFLLISQNFVKSHNCKNELTFAINLQKILLAVQIEEFTLSLGLRLQLANSQYIKREEYTNFESLISKIYSCNLKEFAECKGQPDCSVELRLPCSEGKEVAFENNSLFDFEIRIDEQKIEENNTAQNPLVSTDLAKSSEVDIAMLDNEGKALSMSTHSDSEIKSKEDVIEIDSANNEYESDMDNYEVTMEVEFPNMDDHTVEILEGTPPIIVQLKNGNMYRGNYPLTSIGRDINQCDISFQDNRSLSRHHADVVMLDGKVYVVDRQSVNHTWVNGKKLEKNGKQEIFDFAELRLADEYLFLVVGDAIQKILGMKLLVTLQSERTKESRYLIDGKITLGRAYAWDEGVLSSGEISRKHAILQVKSGKCILKDVSSYNRTWINDMHLVSKQEYELSNKDVIRIGKERFIVTITVLEGSEN